MDKILILIFHLFLITIPTIISQPDSIPYEPVGNICGRCICTKSLRYKKPLFILDCTLKGLKHLVAEWPIAFGTNDTVGKNFIAYFSGNEIKTLQQLPATDANIILFSCRHCQLETILSGVFIDTSNIVRLDLSWNKLTGDVLTGDIFRGAYNDKIYAPINLEYIDLSHNFIRSLNQRIFEHIPNLKYLKINHNPIEVLDAMSIIAINTIPKLMHLDISFTMLSSIPDELFRDMTKLTELILQGNQLCDVPPNLSSLKSLKILYIGENAIEKFNDKSFLGLKHMTYLNISSLKNLKEIGPETFVELKSLEVLIANNNPNLTKFDLYSLRQSKNLRHLELVNCSLRNFNTDFENIINNLTTIKCNYSKLREIKLKGNPWHCDCNFQKSLLELEHYESNEYRSNDNARCKSPYDLSAILLLDLVDKALCNKSINRPHLIPYEPPPFLRPKSIVLSIISVLTVIVFGLIIGLSIVFIKKKLKKNDLDFTAPVRYTTVRNSNSMNTSLIT